MSALSSLLASLQLFLKWKAFKAESEVKFGTHDRYEVQKERVKQIIDTINRATRDGSDVNDLRLLDNELETEQRYLRTLESDLQKWRDVSDG